MRSLPADGDTIRRLRKTRAWTQEQLAAAADCTPRTVRAAERGAKIGSATLNTIAAALEATLPKVTAAGLKGLDEAERNADLIREWHDAYVRQDIGRLLSMHHRDTLLRLPGTEGMPAGGGFSGLAEHRWHYEEVQHVFPIVEVHEMPVHAVGDFVFARPLATVHALTVGQKFTQSHVNEFRFFEGKIVYRTTYADFGSYRCRLAPESPGVLSSV